MDVETAEAVDTLTNDIHQVDRQVGRVETSLTAKIDGVETSLTAKIDGVETSLTAKIERVETSLTARIERVETSLTARIEHVETSLTAKIDVVETSLTAKMHELNEDAKRHTDVRLESMHDDIRLLAENLASLSVQVISLRR